MRCAGAGGLDATAGHAPRPLSGRVAPPHEEELPLVDHDQLRLDPALQTALDKRGTSAASALLAGALVIVGRSFGDAHAGGHGWVDLKESIAQSVNTYYYKLALDLGIDRFDTYMARFGFGQPAVEEGKVLAKKYLAGGG